MKIADKTHNCGTCFYYDFNEKFQRNETVSNMEFGWFCNNVKFEITHAAFQLLTRTGCCSWLEKS